MDFGLLYENDKGEYVVLNDVRTVDSRLALLVYLLVYVSTYYVPIVLLCQYKPFRLLFLGRARIKREKNTLPYKTNYNYKYNLNTFCVSHRNTPNIKFDYIRTYLQLDGTIFLALTADGGRKC